MRLPFELFLALRYLRPKRTFVSVITLISIVGVALGVAVLVIVMSVMSGFDHDLRQKILGFNAQLTIFQNDSTMQHYQRVMEIVSSNRNVTAVAPLVMGQVLLETQPTNHEQSRVSAPWVRGVDSLREGTVSKLPKEMVSGDFDLSGRGIVLGAELADQLNLSVGDRVSIYSPADLKKMKEHRGKSDEEAILPDDYDVRGIFDTGYYEYNASIVVVSLENAQDLYNLNEDVHELSVTLKDPYQAGKVSMELQRALGTNYRVQTWMQQNSTILNALIVEKNVIRYLLFFIVFVAAFGITCTLITFVMMKTGEIGLMKAVGASNRQVMLVFLAQSTFIGLCGIICGLSLGLFAIYVRNGFLHLMNHLTGFELFPASIYGFNELPALISPHDLIIISIGSLFLVLLAAILPARHAARLKPVEALRYE